MDEPPSTSRGRASHQVPWSWRLRARLILLVPQDDRKRVKSLLKTGDAWQSAGYFDAADELYAQAVEIARDARIYHLRKKARQRRTSVSEAPEAPLHNPEQSL